MPEEPGRLVPVHDTELYVVERGASDALPLLVLHGGPGLDHHEFGEYLDPLTDDGRYRLVLVDQRACGRSRRDAPPETWTLETMASDVSGLAAGLGVERYAVLGHSYGAFVALQHAVDAPGAAAATVVSAGIPSTRFLSAVEENLAAFEPVELREQVTASWARESEVRTEEDARTLLLEQMPFHFADPFDPRIAEYNRVATGPTVYAPDVLRHFSDGYGGIDVESRLGTIASPVLITAGRYDRTCTVEAAEVMAAAIPGAELVIFESSGHMMFVEEPDRYVGAVRDFLDRAAG